MEAGQYMEAKTLSLTKCRRFLVLATEMAIRMIRWSQGRVNDRNDTHDNQEESNRALGILRNQTVKL